jgi:tetratricopeptide (TPR) repeat protein
MPPKLDELYKVSKEAFAKGDYEKAEDLFHEILTSKPMFADIQNKLGIIYNQTNRLGLAAEAFEKALAINPGYTEASLNLAITYSDLGKYEKAREVFERAAHFTDKEGRAVTATSGNDPFIKGKLADEHFRLGNMYYDLGLLDEAIEEYQKALRLSPNFADIITRLGIVYRDKGLYDAAIKEFNHAKECNPKYTPARLHLGITYYSQGFYGLAEEEWRETLVFDPDNNAIRTYLNFVKPQNS